MSTEDTVRHSFGPEWEDDAREVLSEVDFDTELGVELARDAQRLSQGKISEDEFFSRHNDMVSEEFGVDARPTDPRSSEPLDEETVNAALNDDVVAEPVPTPHENGGAIGGDGGGGDGDGGRGGKGGDDEDDGMSRRTVLKSVGVAAAGIAAGTWDRRNPGGIWDEDRQIDPAGPGTDNDEVQMGMVIDNDSCIGGAHCVAACSHENQTPAGHLWQFVFQFQEPESDEEEFLVRPCQHCSDPPCVSVCPVRARHKRESDGIVLTDYDICIGCRYCQVACPYGVNHFQWGEPDEEMWDEQFRSANADLPALDDPDRKDDPRYDKRGKHVAGPQHEKGIMGKCVFCVHRQDSGDPELEGTTACEQACPTDSIHFGDLNDPESDPRQYLEEAEENAAEAKAGGEASDEERHLSRWRFQEDRGTKPNVIYLGHQPSEQAEWVDEPGSYDEYAGDTEKVRDGFNSAPSQQGGGD